MRRTELLQEIRKMRFEEAYGGWQSGRLTQEEAARLLGVCERTFRRYIDRYEEAGLEGCHIPADCPDDFALELVRVRHLFSTASIRSSLVAFLAQDERAATDWFARIDRLRRDIDVSWAHDDGKHRLLLVLLPLTSKVGVAGYVDRVVRALREQYGVDFASAGLAVHSTEIDARPLNEQLAAFLERCLV